MPDNDLNKTTTSALNTGVSLYSVSSQTLDSPAQQKETYYDFPDASQHLGYYKTIPELKKAIDALAVWTVGKGVETDSRTKVILDHLKGFGADTFQSIMSNLLIQCKVFGDSFAEIVEMNGILVNIKPLYTGDMRLVVNDVGVITRYEYRVSNNETIKFQPEEILHLCNDRIGNEIHGISIIDACKWVIDARNEAMADWRRISHRSTIRVLYVDVNDSTKLSNLKEQYKDGIKNGEILLLPVKKGDAEFEDLTLPPVQSFLDWIRYLENVFYQVVGVPRVIATSEDYTEAASKVGYMTFEPIYTREQTLLEQNLWNQLSIKVKFNRPPSLTGLMQESEAKNTGQTGFQPNEAQLTPTRTE